MSAEGAERERERKSDDGGKRKSDGGRGRADKAYEEARTSWGFPSFAKDFPRDETLDALVIAFTRGDHRAVRDGAPKLASSTADEAVKRAAAQLLAATEPDPAARLLVLFAAALLVFLTVWWVSHDGPGPERSAPQPVPTIEHVK